MGTIRNVPRTLLYTLTVSGIYCYNGCVSGCWWSATAKSGPSTLFPRAVPGTMTGCHHVASFSRGFYAVPARFFDQKNYGAWQCLGEGKVTGCTLPFLPLRPHSIRLIVLGLAILLTLNSFNFERFCFPEIHEFLKSIPKKKE